jgi:hypothetical protein
MPETIKPGEFTAKNEQSSVADSFAHSVSKKTD